MAVLILLAISCGSGDSTSSAPGTTTTTTAPRPTVDATRLTEGWACGYGFAVGSPEQDLSLKIYFQSSREPDRRHDRA